ncbi:MAG: phosphopyruvate hydratase [Ruminococcus sp.]|nr:phosphopyruvate hydratase [Ruminococcus sp.]
METKIKSVNAREILDSRGFPTVECEVMLENGAKGVAAVPSGASTGEHEAVELRDKDARYMGKGVKKAVTNVNSTIAPALLGQKATNQLSIDSILTTLDSTDNKSKLGANALLSVSMAVAKAAANAVKLPLYRYLGNVYSHKLPVPMMNILNGGAHASNNIDIQEFMIMPVGFRSFAEAIRAACEVYHTLGKLLKEKNLSTAVGDEGGFAPNLQSDEDAIELILEAINAAGFNDAQIKLALDAASSEWFSDGKYVLPKRGVVYTGNELAAYFSSLKEKYPIISIEDPLAEDDWQTWQSFTNSAKDSLQIVGDDLFVTNYKRLEKGISLGAANSILIKVNQIGTLSETFRAIETAHRAGYTTVISHRSGETEDTTIADIAVAVNAGQIKTGAPCRSERVAKYNRLLKIEQELGNSAVYTMN